MDKVDTGSRPSYYHGELESNELINLITSEITIDDEALTKKYHKLINQCINHKLFTKHKLKATSKILYCDSSEENEIPRNSIDWWNISFFVVLGSLIVISLICTIFDLSFRKGKSRLITAFSMVRNVEKLFTRRGSEDLQFLDSQRFLLNIAVISAHIYLKIAMGPVKNPIFFENEDFWMLENGTIFISTFFVMSSFLLTVNFLKDMKSSDVNIGNFGLTLFNRYFRLTVPYIFMILLHGLDVYPDVLGPSFKYFMEKEKWGCRNYWYSKILYMDNYNFRHNFCLVQGWYLAADMQIFVLCLLLLMLLLKKPKQTVAILGSSVVLSIIVRGLTIYFNHLEPNAIPTLHDLKTLFFEFPTGLILYLHSETNFGSGVIGMIAGFIYHNLKNKKFNLGGKTWFKVLFWLNFPIGVIYYFSCYFFLDRPKPSLMVAIFGGFSTNIWAFVCSVFMLGMAFNVNNVFRKLFVNPIFSLLGQLSYSVYLTHMYVVIIAFALMGKELHANHYLMVILVMGLIVASYAAGIFLTLFVEIPSTVILKVIMGKLKGLGKKNVVKKKE
ncbi:hypothetical protein ACFFRR_007174 [Megaselia abdita]